MLARTKGQPYESFSSDGGKTWSNVTPCNMHIDKLALEAEKGANAGGGKAIIFNTITISDGISMGHEGMRASLVSRENIADSYELVMHAERFDGAVTIAGCDKSLPGMMMAMLRLNVPAIFLYGCSIMPGKFHGKDVTVVDVFEGVGKHSAGAMSDEELFELECVACPGAGACGGQFTANTMAMVGEALGLSPLGSAMVPPTLPPVASVACASG